MRIFAVVHRLGFRDAAVLIRLPAARQRMVDHVAIAADDRNLHAGNRQNIAGMGNHVFVLSRGQHLLVGRVDFFRGSTGLGVNVGSVVNEGSYGDLVH